MLVCVYIDSKYICSVYILHEGVWVAIYISNPVIISFFCLSLYQTENPYLVHLLAQIYYQYIYKLLKCLVKFVLSNSSENISPVTFLYLITYFKQVGKGHEARRYTEQIMQIVMLSSVSKSY